ncbi:MAG: SpoIIIAH-like family protein [Clostridia bacterium]|nr:SpoIIIAH-like family protein [Clostridia bacterium]
MSKKKKIIILSCMIALLAVTAVCNFLLSGDSVYDNTTSTAYFSEYRSERSSSRNEQILQLDKIIAESQEDSEVRETALTQKMQLTMLTEQELKLETLIKAYGYEEVVVTMSITSPNVSVIVKNDTFDQADAVKIYNLLTQETQVDSENINIIPYI